MGRTSTVQVAARSVLRRFPWLRDRLRVLIYRGVDEGRVVDAALAAVRAGDCVWDVGANTGVYTRMFAEAVGREGCVIAIDPLPGVQVSLASIDGVRAVQAALTDHDGHGTISVHGHESGRASRIDETGDVPVRLARADTLAREVPRPDVAKIDVEGFELDALTGFGALLDAVRVVIVEMHFGRLAERGVQPGRVVDLLEGHGLEVRWIDPSHLIASRV